MYDRFFTWILNYAYCCYGNNYGSHFPWYFYDLKYKNADISFIILPFSANLEGLYLARKGSYVNSDGRYSFARCHRENMDN